MTRLKSSYRVCPIYLIGNRIENIRNLNLITHLLLKLQKELRFLIGDITLFVQGKLSTAHTQLIIQDIKIRAQNNSLTHDHFITLSHYPLI